MLNVKRLDKHVQESISGIKTEMKQQQNQTLVKLKQLEEQQASIKTMLTQIVNSA